MVNGNGGEESAGKYQGNCFLSYKGVEMLSSV